MSKSVNSALIALAAATRFDALRGADAHFVEQGRTAAALLNALKGADPWVIAAIAVLTEESLPGRGFDGVRSAMAREIIGGELLWSSVQVKGANGRVKVTQSRDRFWVLLDGAAALEGWWHSSTTTRTPAFRKAEALARRLKTTTAAAAYTAARLEVEAVLTRLSPIERGNLAEWLCMPSSVAQPTTFGGWEAHWGQNGGTLTREGDWTGVPVAAGPALRRASLSAGSTLAADIAAFEAAESRRKAAEGRKVARMFRQLAEAAWTASCLEREAAALASVSRLKAVHA
jgi:hypothetical protein